MSKVKEVKKLLKLVEKYDLEGREILKKYTPIKLAKIYNGIGPDAFPEWLRDIITDLHPSLAVVALIHDVEWYESDGTEASFTTSNDRFRRNGYKVAKTEYGWWNPARYFVMLDARKFSWACQEFGWGAWLTDGSGK